MHGAESQLDMFGIAWRLGATLFFVLLNGFFVAAEFALVKARVSKIQALANQGRRSARVVEHMLRHMDRYLSACQLGITLASLILGALGEPAVSRLLLAAAVGMGVEVETAPVWLPYLSIGLAFAVITMLHMTVGEQAPKMWALRRSEATTLQTAYPLHVFTIVFGPFIAVINSVSNWMLRLGGLPPGYGPEGVHTAEEIRSILSLSASAGHITDREVELTENVFRLVELEVRHIVVPRVDVAFLSDDRTSEENLEILRSSGHTRFPLCEVGLDSVVGFVHGKDVLDHVLREKALPALRPIARPPLFVPDSMPLSDFLIELQTQRAHCAAVVDERGTVIGLGFREDALEEIVGPLGDEFDPQLPEFKETEDGAVEVRGRMALPELLSRLDLQLPDEEDEGQDTIAGHVTARLGRLARPGDEVDVGPYRARVLGTERQRIQRVRLERRAEHGDVPDSGAASP